jgi:hypothetical protein
MTSSTFDQPPRWAVRQRDLFRLLDRAWRRFEELYCAPDGSLVFDGRTFGRDGADDFYEPFFNWPALYRLGGAGDLLDACKRHWTGVSAQLSARGLLTGGFDNGYDWFHQGESMLFFYNLCAADPGDPELRRQAREFADLFVAGGPNYDPELRMMRAPHIGALGPRLGLGLDSVTDPGMRMYGLPLRDVPGIATWDDLFQPGAAERMAEAMDVRLGVGDIPLNLASTALVANAWLYDHSPRYSSFVTSYVDAWAARAAENDGLIPDNVGPDGRVGEMHGGRWYGGHYGWAWPHGLYSLIAPALVAGLSATLVTGDDSWLAMPRDAVEASLRRVRRGPLDPDDCTFYPAWRERLGAESDGDLLQVPYRRDQDGWFDYQPLPPAYPAWLWWVTRDRSGVDELAERSGYDWRTVRQFREKEEAGHEPPWLRFLAGDNPAYPEQALDLAIAQATERLARMEAQPTPPPGDDIHWWQGLNPVVTEVLTQQIGGAPQQLYNGGLPMTQLQWFSGGRPGLPDDVAVLVTALGDRTATVEVVNLGLVPKVVTVTGGGYGEHPIDGPSEFELQPRSQTRLDLTFTRFGRTARHLDPHADRSTSS